jgi:hypothetical protein
MINYNKTKTCRVLLNYDWQISEQFLWSLFVVTFKAKTEEELGKAIVSVINDLDTDLLFKRSLTNAIATDIEECLK